jgi:zinc protease
MIRRALPAIASLGLLVACAEGPLPPPNVPGPTTAPQSNVPVTTTPTPEAAKPSGPVALRTPDARVVAIRIVFAAGSADDPAGKEGAERLTATLMAEGGTQALSYAELVAKLYPMAASIDAHVDRDETVFEATVTRDSLEQFYPLLRDVLLTPRFDDASFARLRARQASELTSDLRGANDEELGKEVLQATLYEGHPYGHPTLGTERGLAAITLGDVKAQYARALCRDRVTVGVAGGYPEGFEKTVLADMAKLPACAAARAALPPAPTHQGFQLVVVDKPSAGSTAVSIGFPTPVTRSDPDFPGMRFATDVLGLHREASGRLYRELREKRGLNYGDYAYAEFFEQEGYARIERPNLARREQFVSLWLRPVKRPNAAFAVRAALRVYTKAVTEGIDEADLGKMRDYLTRRVVLSAQTESRRLGYAIDTQTYGLDAPYLDVLRRGWAALDVAKLKDLMQRRLDAKNLTIVIVAADGQKLADELLKGEPSALPAYDSPKPPDVQAEDREIVKFPIPLEAKNVRVVPVGDLFK